jgi:hypothetical protein
VAKHFCYYDGDKCADCRNQIEAADEIEQLRRWKELAYDMKHTAWWALRSKYLVMFRELHNTDWEKMRGG